jgi:hypothetical protein
VNPLPQETLRRLHSACVTLGHKHPSSPKEIEAIIDAIDEFVFNCGGNASANAGNSSGSSSSSGDKEAKKTKQQAASATTALQDLQESATI